MIVKVVFSLEHGPAPVPLGVYLSTVEDSIRYATVTAGARWAPADCVVVVDVDVMALAAAAA